MVVVCVGVFSLLTALPRSVRVRRGLMGDHRTRKCGGGMDILIMSLEKDAVCVCGRSNPDRDRNGREKAGASHWAKS